MDPKQLEELIRKMVNEQVATPWWIYLVLMVLSGCIGFFIAYLNAYATTKGKNLATKEDFNQILEQTKKTTEATEQIKTNMATELAQAMEKGKFLAKKEDFAEILDQARRTAEAAEKGKNLATKEDFIELLEQIKATTKATEAIKAEIEAETAKTTEKIRAELSKASAIGQSELEYRKQQLAEFYGPVSALLISDLLIWQRLKSGELKDVAEQSVELLRNINDEIKSILINKTHLMEGPEAPNLIFNALPNAMRWNSYALLVQRDIQHNVRFHEHVLNNPPWSDEFLSYIAGKLDELKKRLDDLYGRFSIVQQDTEQRTQPVKETTEQQDASK
jgi:hypothetical protein